MATGISGYGPETHDSMTSLSQLLIRIAAYRDEFYRLLIREMKGAHGARLREEAKRLQQPFGGARQSLNRELTNCRALQIQRVHLARIYARMDYPAVAEEQMVQIQVPVGAIELPDRLPVDSSSTISAEQRARRGAGVGRTIARSHTAGHRMWRDRRPVEHLGI